MHKTIFSKVLRIGGARVSTVGLGVILAIMLGFAAATTTATPAAAIPNPGLLSFIRVENSIEVYSFEPNDPKGQADDTPRYTVPVVTRWEDTSVSRLQLWIGQNCTATRPQWRLERQVGTDPTWQVLKQGTTEQGAEVVQDLQTNTRYLYRWIITCKKIGSDKPIEEIKYGKAFQIRVVENDQVVNEPGLSLSYSPDWIKEPSVRYSGGTTHEALQDGPYADLRYEGLAAAWLTTADDSSTFARVDCLNTAGTFVVCGDVNTKDPDPGEANTNQRVAWTSDAWHRYTVSQRQAIRVISEDNHGVDVDAFFIVNGVQ
jgi:hypothetical protein